MITYVLDASALLRYLDREPGFNKIADLFKVAVKGDAQLLVSAVNWGEIVSVSYEAHGLTTASATTSRLRDLPFTRVTADAAHAEGAPRSSSRTSRLVAWQIADYRT